MQSLRRILLFPAIVGILLNQASAATVYWDGDGAGTVGGGSGTWNTANARWSATAGGNTYAGWTAGNTASFGGTAGTVTIAATAPSAGGLEFTTSGYTITASTLTMTAGNIDVQGTSASNATINSTLAIGTNAINKIGGGTLILGGGTSNTGTGTFTISDGGVELAKTTTATGIALSSTNINIGDSTGAAGSATLKLTGASTNQIQDAAVLNVRSDGTVDLNGKTETISNVASMSGGSITTAGAAGGKLVLAAATNSTLTATGSNTISSDLQLSSSAAARTRIIDTTGATDSLSISGAISEFAGGPGSITKNGAGTLTLSGPNSYSGTTTVSAGTLVLSGSNSSAGNTTLSGGTLSLGTGTNNGLASGTLSLGTGTVQSTDATSRSVSNAITLAGNTTFGGTGDLSFTNTGASALAATRTLTVDNTNTSISAAISGATFGITKGGLGTLTLAGNAANTYTGTTTVNAGDLVLSKSAGNAVGGNLTLNGGDVQLAGNDQIVDTSVLSVTNGTLDVNGNSDTVGSISTMSGGSITGGALTLSGAASTLTGTGSNTITSDVQLNTGSALTRTFALTNAGDSLDISGDLTEGTAAASLTKSGAGTLTLSGTNSYSGTTTVSAGTLVANGTNSSAGGTTLSGGVLSLGAGANGGLASGTLSLGTAIVQSTDATSRTVSSPITLAGNTTFGGTGALSFTSNAASAIAATRTLQVDVDTQISAAISGATFGLTKNGLAALTLNGNAANTFTGTTTVNAGTLVLDKSAGNAVGGNLTISGATVRLDGNDQIADGAAISATNGTLNMNGNSDTAGSVSTLANSSITGGSLALSGASNTTTATGASSITSDLQLTTGTAATRTISLTSAGDSLSLSGNVGEGTAAGSLSLGGAGTLTLSGTNSYSGLTTIGSGTLIASGTNNSAGGTTLSGGVLRLGSGSNGGLAGGTLSLGTATIQSTDATSRSLSNPITLAGNTTFGGTGSLSFTNNAASALTATRTLQVDVDTEIAAAISGATFGLTKNGAGTLTLNGNAGSTYTGATTVNTGLLVLAKSSGNAIGGGLTINGATTRLDGSNQIADGGVVSVNSGTLNMNGNSDTVGSISTLSSGSVTGGSVALSAASNTLTGTGTNSISSNLQLTTGTAATRTIALAGAADALTISGAITQGTAAGSITKTGSGDLTFSGSGSNTYNGLTTVSGGLLALAKTSGNAIGGSLTINGATVRLDGNDQIADGAAISVTNGTLNMNGNSDTVGSVSTLATSSITGGPLALSGASNTLTVTGTSSIDDSLQLTTGSAATRTITTTAVADNLTLSGAITEGSAAGSITKSGSGDLFFTGNGNNTYTGLTTVSAGNVYLNKTTGNAIGGNLTVSSGAGVHLGGNNQIADTSVVSLTGTTLDLNGKSDTIGSLSNLLSSSTINAGSLAMNSSSSTATVTGTGSIVADLQLTTAASGAQSRTFSMTAAGDSLTISGNISDDAASPGTLIKAGPGPLTLTGTNTHTGGTKVNAGTLFVASNSNLGASTAPLTLGSGTSSAGTLRMNAAFNSSRPIALGTSTTTTQNNIDTDGNAADSTFTGAISGTGSLTKLGTGAGALYLNGGGSWTGSLNASQGTLGVTAGTLSPSTSLTVANAATLNVGGTGQISTGSGTFSGGSTVDVSGNAIIAVTGALSFNNAAAIDVSGNGRITSTGALTTTADVNVNDPTSGISVRTATHNPGSKFTIDGSGAAVGTTPMYNIAPNGPVGTVFSMTQSLTENAVAPTGTYADGFGDINASVTNRIDIIGNGSASANPHMAVHVGGADGNAFVDNGSLINITDGGYFKSGNIIAGDNPNSNYVDITVGRITGPTLSTGMNGAMIIEGTGSRADIVGRLGIGDANATSGAGLNSTATGVMRVMDGATLNLTGIARVGSLRNGTGSLLIDNATFNTEDVGDDVGPNPNAAVTGGYLTVVEGDFFHNNATGQVIVNGPNAVWNSHYTGAGDGSFVYSAIQIGKYDTQSSSDPNTGLIRVDNGATVNSNFAGNFFPRGTYSEDANNISLGRANFNGDLWNVNDANLEIKNDATWNHLAAATQTFRGTLEIGLRGRMNVTNGGRFLATGENNLNISPADDPNHGVLNIVGQSANNRSTVQVPVMFLQGYWDDGANMAVPNADWSEGDARLNISGNGLLNLTSTTQDSIAFNASVITLGVSGNPSDIGEIALAAGRALIVHGDLQGNGKISGDLVAEADSTVSPGFSSGLVTVTGNITLDGLMNMELGDSDINDYDRIRGTSATGTETANVTGTLDFTRLVAANDPITHRLTYDLVTSKFVVASPTTLANGLADAQAAFMGSGANYFSLAVVPYAGGFQSLQLIVDVPEPSSLALLGMALAALLVVRRRSQV